MEAYGYVKYTATLWMSAMAKEHKHLKFISLITGGTKGTAVMDHMPGLMGVFYKYIAMPILLPMMGMAHNLEVGSKRFIDAMDNNKLKTGKFYGSKEKVLTGPIIDQSTIFPDLNNESYQQNAKKAIESFI